MFLKVSAKNNFLNLSMMTEHDMAIVISGSFYLGRLLLEFFANQVKVFTIQVLHKIEQVVVFTAASRNIEFLFVDRRGSVHGYN